ncbi:hypothetical protein [Pelomicrobium sp.]
MQGTHPVDQGSDALGVDGDEGLERPSQPPAAGFLAMWVIRSF